MSFDLQKIIKAALSEDMPNGDLTTDSLQIADRIDRAKLVAKEDLVLSGTEPFRLTFTTVDPTVDLKWQFKDGDFVFKGQTICLLKGPLPALLKAERTALNFLGRLSGIASLTRCYVLEIKNGRTKILDTRKTTPLLRALEKAAVVHGGGQNHRMHLSEAVLIKENHIRACRSITEAVKQVRAQGIKNIEVEVSCLAEVQEALTAKVNRILLDNMTNTEMAECLKLIPSSVITEASGNMTIERIRSVADLGIDFISVGAITHSAPCADVSLLFEV